jgi:hypothetical protein
MAGRAHVAVASRLAVALALLKPLLRKINVMTTQLFEAAAVWAALALVGAIVLRLL